MEISKVLSWTWETSLLWSPIIFCQIFSHLFTFISNYILFSTRLLSVEWSHWEDFRSLAGCQILEDLSCPSYEITDLDKGVLYYVRVSAANIKGFGLPSISDPPCAIPSSWRDIENNHPRTSGKLELLGSLFTQLKNLRPADASEIKGNWLN